MKIYLIGMPGSGKSTLGRQLAEALRLPFVDLDAEIERLEGKAITDVFSQEGEEHFREVESKVLKSWADAPKEFVMATGGGAPCFHQGIDVINASGLSVFLDVSVPELVRRLEKEEHRPLLQDADRTRRLEELREKRLPVYQQAHLHIANEATSFEEILQKVRARM